ncbi:hypothetical protein KKF81_03910 [Candidatus Micrarchaeota archaeon]|nr:hypothetical protein [Candidatus Micrarchaeota archaeon]
MSQVHRVLNFRNPQFCNEHECQTLVGPGYAFRNPRGGLIHDNMACWHRYEERPLELVRIEYKCTLPSDSELYRLERLPAIKPLERVAAKLEPQDAKAMYEALAKIYVNVTFGNKWTRNGRINDYRLLAQRFVSPELCLVLDAPVKCAYIECDSEIWEGMAYQTNDGKLYHTSCADRADSFRTGKNIGQLKPVFVRYSCDPPENWYMQRLLDIPEIQTLERIFSRYNQRLARKAYTAIANMLEKCGIYGHDLEKMAEKYNSTLQ